MYRITQYFVELKRHQKESQIIIYCIRQNIQGGKLSQFEYKMTIHGKMFTAAASFNNECL